MNRGANRWNTLTHKGPAFPQPYKRLPTKVKLVYGRETLKGLSPAAEESACLYARILLAKHKDAKNKTFNANFFEDFRALLSTTNQRKVATFKNLNFSQIVKHLKKVSTAEKASKALKAKQKKLREKLKKDHGFFTVNGKKQPLGNFMVEPPGIFRGREGNPNHGRIKLRIKPSDVIINCSKGAKIEPPRNAKWKKVVNIKTATWLAKYTNSLGEIKYIQPGQTSNMKTKDDEKKYEVARSLGDEIGRIRRTYRKNLDSRHEFDRQLGVAIYFIDVLALRVGHEKGAGETDTVGCCTLRKEHISVKAKNKVAFDFKGKDSIRYNREVKIDPKVHKVLQSFLKKKKSKKDKLFDLLNATELNTYLKEELSPNIKLTAKVFRTYQASALFEKELNKGKNKKKMSEDDLLVIYQKANRQVAILCNHKKAVDKRKVDKTLKKMQQRIKQMEADSRFLDFDMGNHNQHNQKLHSLKARYEAKSQGKDLALGTSKQNYIDPRITFAWCKKHGIDPKKVFSKTLLAKYNWATKIRRTFKF